MVSHVPHAPPWSPTLHIVYSIVNNCFWWLLCDDLPNWPIYATVYFNFIIVVLLHLMSKTMGRCFPMRSTPPASPLQHPHYLDCCSPVGCCIVWLNGSHLWPRPCPSAYFLMGYASVPQRKEPTSVPPNLLAQAFHGLVGRRCTKS